MQAKRHDRILFQLRMNDSRDKLEFDPKQNSKKTNRARTKDIGISNVVSNIRKTCYNHSEQNANNRNY